MLAGMMQGNRQETMAFRCHVDAQHPNVFGEWIAEQNENWNVWYGLKFRPRINQRHRAGLNRDYLHRWQHRRREVAGGSWSAWVNTHNAAPYLRITASDFYDDRDQCDVLHFADEQGNGISDTTNAFYLDNLPTTDQVRWRGVGNYRMEPEINLTLAPPAAIGNIFQLRFVRHNGDSNEFADLNTASFTVIADPTPTPTFPEGPLDEAIATVLDVAGVGDFSAPAVASTPVIVVGQMLDEPDAMIGVVNVGGGRVDRIFGERPKVTIVSRDRSYVTARDRAKAVADALHEYSGAQLGRVIARVSADSEPVYRARDRTGRTGGRAVWSQTFTVISRQKIVLH